jgi:hypothetical protein
MHLGQRQLKCKSGFSSLVLVYPIRMQRVATSTGGRIIERLPKIVASQKPLKAAARRTVPSRVSSQRIGFQTCGDRRVGLQRLLIKAGVRATASPESVTANGREMAGI